MRVNFKRSILVFAVALPAALSTVGYVISAGCKKAEPVSATGEVTKVRIGYIGLTCEAPIFTAVERGFFKEEGLDARWIELQGRPMITAGLTGNLDFVPIPSGGANAVLTANAPLRYIVN